MAGDAARNKEVGEMARQLRSTITSDGRLELRLVEVEVPKPAADEVVVRVEATPINPSDLGLLLGPADVTKAETSGTAEAPVVTAPVPEGLLASAAARFDQSMAVGNEGAGTVIEAGSDPGAQALLGKTVAVLGREMYSELRVVKAAQCLLLPEGTTAAEGASCFVNPLTVLGFVETMRLEGHSALVHTAAASNLGQMLQRVCLADGIPLVNIVRKPEQAELLRSIGATHVVNSSEPAFLDDLTSALQETGATLGFDAIGGGRLASDILACMERAALAGETGFSRYGSTVHKQVYLYGSLDPSPTELRRTYGTVWGIGGWLLTPFLERIGAEATERLRQRVAAEVKTTFASAYAKEISLAEALDLGIMAAYARRATGEKYLINPNKAG
jgi:NADPH2:quinone reductase